MVKLIGTGANQVPTNNMLGNMAFQNKEGVAIDLLGLAAGTAAAPSLIPTGDPNTGVWFPAADTIAASTGGTERIRIDSSGNVGVAVTPSAWTTYKAIQLNGMAAFSAGNNDGSIGYNVYYDGSYRYRVTETAAMYTQYGRQHLWYSAVSGSAGSAISFTQAMTLDATGRLLVGTTSAGIANNSATALTLSSGQATVYQSMKASGGEELFLYSASGSVGVYSYTNTPMIFGTNNAERMRVDATGNIFIGGTSNASSVTLNKSVYLQSSVNNDVIGYSLFVNDSANNRRAAMFLDDANGLFGWDVTASSGVPAYVWRTASTERMRIDSSGNVGIGTTGIGGGANDRQLTLQGASSAQATFVAATSSVFSSVGVNSTIAYIGSTSNHPLTFFSNNTERMRIDSSGNVGIGTASPVGKLQVNSTDVARIAYIAGTTAAVRIGSNASGAFVEGVDAAGGVSSFQPLNVGGSITSFYSAGSERMRIDANGNVIVNTAAIATTATNGFLYIPGCAGTPTGVPTAQTGRVPLVVDTTNNKLYFYSNGAWRDAGP